MLRYILGDFQNLDAVILNGKEVRKKSGGEGAEQWTCNGKLIEAAQ